MPFWEWKIDVFWPKKLLWYTTSQSTPGAPKPHSSRKARRSWCPAASLPSARWFSQAAHRTRSSGTPGALSEFFEFFWTTFFYFLFYFGNTSGLLWNAVIFPATSHPSASWLSQGARLIHSSGTPGALGFRFFFFLDFFCRRPKRPPSCLCVVQLWNRFWRSVLFLAFLSFIFISEFFQRRFFSLSLIFSNFLSAVE